MNLISCFLCHSYVDMPWTCYLTFFFNIFNYQLTDYESTILNALQVDHLPWGWCIRIIMKLVFFRLLSLPLLLAINRKRNLGIHSFKLTSKSIISLGAGASGLSPVSSIGISSFRISFSRNPAKNNNKKHIEN